MPVTYQIDADQKVIRTQCSDQLTFQEVIEHFQQLVQDSSRPDRLDVLLDVSEATSLPERSQLQSVGEELRAIRGQVRFGVCAIVAKRDALFGMMRVFEVIAEEYFDATRVFRSVADAEAWLRAQRSRSIS